MGVLAVRTLSMYVGQFSAQLNVEFTLAFMVMDTLAPTPRLMPVHVIVLLLAEMLLYETFEPLYESPLGSASTKVMFVRFTAPVFVRLSTKFRMPPCEATFAVWLALSAVRLASTML